MSSGRSLPQFNLGVQGGIQGDSHSPAFYPGHFRIKGLACIAIFDVLMTFHGLASADLKITKASTIAQCLPSGCFLGQDSTDTGVLDDWKRVTWSDRFRLRLLKADRRLRIWRQTHEAMYPACQGGNKKGHGGSIMIWGVFSWNCLGPFVRVQASLNAIRYVELKADHIHQFLLFCYSHGNGVFQQNNCTSHKFQFATGWFDEHPLTFLS
ncbi:transposable element Tcb2 transposase [Trichonephila clavipes]|nr:transposable element Tcb2 transposase [Trichonephila clavipes]